MIGSPNRLGIGEARVLILLAQPGHELYVHGWMERVRPLVLMLTDGSDVRGRSSLASVSMAVRESRSRIGNLFGRFTDRGLLHALLTCDHDRFMALAEEVAELLVTEEIDWVVGPAGEGHSPGADVCRILLDAASALVSRRLGQLRNYDFSLRHRRGTLSFRNAGRQMGIEIDGESWERKRRALLAAPGTGHLLQQSEEEVDRWKREVLQLAQPWQLFRLDESGEFDYPSASGGVTVRFREHILPLAESLRLLAASGRKVA